MSQHKFAVLASVFVVGSALSLPAFGDYTVFKISSQYVATNAVSGLLLNMSVRSSQDHTLSFDSVRANPQGTTVLDLTGTFAEEGGTEWTLTWINGSACASGQAPIKTILTEVRLPETLEVISWQAFANCTKLAKVTPFLPSSLKELRDRAFYGTPVAGDLKLSNPELRKIDFYAFLCENNQPRNGITSVDFTGSGVTNIGASVFKNCINLTTVVFSEVLETIDSSAFSGCTKLTSVTPFLPGTVTTIGDFAFENTRVDGDLVLTNRNLKTIGGKAFYGDTAKWGSRIRSVNLAGSGVTAIGNYAFAYQPALTNVVLSDVLTTLGNESFRACTNLTSVTPFFPATLTSIGSKCFARVPLTGDCVLSNPQMTVFPADVFSQQESGSANRCLLRSVDFTGSGVTQIGNYAFYLCTNLTSVTLPEKLEKIGEYSFASCASLTSVTPLLPGTLTTLASYAFDLSPVDGDLVLTNRNLKTIGGRAFYGITTGWRSRLRSVNLAGSGVTTIGNSAFSYQPALTNVVLSDVLTTIGSSVFIKCTNLTTVTPFLPATLISLGSSCFSRTPVEGDCVLSNPQLTIFPSGVFSQDESVAENRGRLRSIDFTGSGVTNICANSVCCQRRLARVVLPDVLETVGGDAFYSCTNLTEVTPLLPKSCWSIASRAFSGAPIVGDFVMSNKKAVTIPGSAFESGKFTSVDLRKTSITTLGGYSFARNKNLVKVVLPKTMATFNTYVFYDTPNLRQLYYSNDFGMPPLPAYSVFFGVEKQKWLRIYVPADAPDWHTYLSTYGRALTDDEIETFKAEYPGERLPVGLVPYPNSDSKYFQYLCHWKPNSGLAVIFK